MRTCIAATIIALALLTSCAPVPSLWGTYASPTPDFPIVLEYPVTLVPASATTAAPLATATFTPTPTLIGAASETPEPLTGSGSDPSFLESTLTPTFDVQPVLYYAQSGDTIHGVAARFGIDPSEVHAETTLPDEGLIPPGTLLIMPDRIGDATSPADKLIPDSELVFSGTGVDFDLREYIESSGGQLSRQREYLGSTGWNTGFDEIKRLSYENSINPRLLLALLEYESRWVRAEPIDSLHRDYPMGYINLYYKGLFGQMLWAVNQLSVGYYGWRDGTLTTLRFPDGSSLRLEPSLNSGTVALQYLFSKQHNQSQWAQMIDPGNGFLAVYTDMFGDPWARADTVEPLLPPGLSQPELELPFDTNIGWSFTGGPHGAWEHDGSLAAIDFAPFTDHGGCDTTTTWITAAAPGRIVRSERGVVVQDLDGDGYEQTGWALIYLHVGSVGRVADGTYVELNDRIGHASCEGGQATGTHLHFVRKYNGEWVAADGPIPFTLSGWTVRRGSLPYEGTLVKADQTIYADPVGQLKSVIIRTLNDE